MKANDIQRAVRVQRYDRAAGDAPILGRVSRMPGTGLPKKHRRKRKQHGDPRNRNARANRKKALWAWSVVFGLLSFCAITIAMIFGLKSSRANTEEASNSRQNREESQTRVISKFESPPEDAALKWVKQAMLVRDPASVVKYFRVGSHAPESVVSFLEGLARSDGPITGYNWLSSMDRNGLLIDGVLVNEQGDAKPKNRIALLTPDEKGLWQIDFEAFARICKPPISELIAGKHQGGTVRVFITSDSYYNGVFSDDSQWSCYKLASPDAEEALLGYCVKSSAQDQAMIRMISNSESISESPVPVRATLELRRISGSESKLVEISRVLAEDWIMTESAFDSNFK